MPRETGNLSGRNNLITRKIQFSCLIEGDIESRQHELIHAERFRKGATKFVRFRDYSNLIPTVPAV